MIDVSSRQSPVSRCTALLRHVGTPAVCAACFTLLPILPVSAGSDPGVVLVSDVVSALGGPVRSGDVSLSATLGQPAAGFSQLGDVLESAGFWRTVVLSLVDVSSTADPELGTTFRLLPNAPNPFSVSTTLRYVLPTANGRTRVSIQIFDVAGRLVRELDPGVLAPGRHAAVWDGTTDHGQRAGTGIYFCRVSAGPSHAIQKLVLAR